MEINNNNNWKLYIGKKVRLIVEDPPSPYPKARDGIFIDIDETHVWLKIEFKEIPVPFLRSSIKRVEIKGDNRGY